MKKLIIQPLGESALVTTGTPLLSALLAKDLHVLMSCGGKGMCSTCHVRVQQGMDQLSPIGVKERRTLSLVADTTVESRLACQTHVFGDGVVVRVPDGMYIEKAEDLDTLLGTQAPENILHPISGSVLIPKGKLITRTLLEQSRHLEAEVRRLRDGSSDSVSMDSTRRQSFSASGIATRPNLSGTTQFSLHSTIRTKPPATPVSASSVTPPPGQPLKKSEAISKPPVRSTPSKKPETYSRTEIVLPSEMPGTTKTPLTIAHPVKANCELKEKTVEAVRAGAQIDKYLLLEQVGKGGAGIVFRALHTKLKTLVAVKFLRTDVGIANGPGLEQMAKEAQLLAQLQHPNVVRVLDFEDRPSQPYVVMEFVDGLTASDLIKQSGRISASRAIEIALDVTGGLEAAWKIGIIHRDVKPGNILVTKSGRSKLVDLGLATIKGDGTSDQPAGTGPVEGTVGYMSPEAINGDKIDHRSDMYSLGATLFHLMAGRLPFTGRSPNEVVLKHLQAPVPDIHEMVHEVPVHISQLISTLMAKQPDGRFQDYAELREELRALQEELADQPFSNALK
ncbi:hypothetical protein BH11PLA2_BH11PLA2_31480 [soil metagenome]